MNTTLENLRYQNRSAPLEHKITFNELQSRPVGFQTAIPIDTTLEKMNSLEFKSMEGAMFEAANSASAQIRAQKQTEVMVDQAAAINEIPREAAQAMAKIRNFIALLWGFAGAPQTPRVGRRNSAWACGES